MSEFRVDGRGQRKYRESKSHLARRNSPEGIELNERERLLREALAKHEYRYGGCRCREFRLPTYTREECDRYELSNNGADIRYKFWIDHVLSALASTEQPAEQVEAPGVMGDEFIRYTGPHGKPLKLKKPASASGAGPDEPCCFEGCGRLAVWDSACARHQKPTVPPAPAKGEEYPGQAYFHEHNANIRNSELRAPVAASESVEFGKLLGQAANLYHDYISTQGEKSIVHMIAEWAQQIAASARVEALEELQKHYGKLQEAANVMSQQAHPGQDEWDKAIADYDGYMLAIGVLVNYRTSLASDRKGQRD